MSSMRPTYSLLLDRAERLLESLGARLVLSMLILASLLPSRILEGLGWVQPAVVFVTVFGLEFTLRCAVMMRRARRRGLKFGETLVLVLDFVALLSFLPLTKQVPWLRHLRIGRLFLLLGYWSGMLRELGAMLSRRERRHQILIVLALGGVLAFGGATVLLDLGVAYDFDQDGKIEHDDHSFAAVLWWSFLQIQDTGNMEKSLQKPPVILAISILLTLSGVLLLSFLIGIGTTVVGELLERSRAQAISDEDHTVILGLTPYTVLLLKGLAEIYRKNLRPYRGAVMAQAPAFEALESGRDLHFKYRQGDPARISDLARVNIAFAKRVIILGDESRDPDAAVISAILAARQSHASVPLYVDMEHERNFPAARAAGGPHTHLVGSGSMLGYYVAQNVAYPEVYHLYRHLLQSAGAEIYTYLFSPAERNRMIGEISIQALHDQAGFHRTTLLGLFVADDDTAPAEQAELVLNPVVATRHRQGMPSYALSDKSRLRCAKLRGIVGIALRFDHLATLAWEVLDASTDDPRFGDSDTSVSTDSSDARPTPARFSSLQLHPGRPAPERILILGAGPRVPRVVRELIGFFPGLDITVVADQDAGVEPVAHDVLAMLSRSFTEPPPDLHTDRDGVWRIRLEAKGRQARVTLMAADWTHGHRLQQRGAVTLEAADVILLLPINECPVDDTDSDGRIALDGLHLANLERTGTVRFRPDTHILALVRDPAKGDLLESRLNAMAGETRTCRYTVMSRERARHRFIKQNVFVRGLSSVYLHLLGSQGRHFARLVPSGDDGEPLRGAFDPRALADELLTGRGWLLIGFEQRPGAPAAGSANTRGAADGDASIAVTLDPKLFVGGKTLQWSNISALYIMVGNP